MDALEPVRRNILRILKGRRMSGAALARGLGHSTSWASNFLSGKKTIPVETVAEIADFLAIPVWQLFAPVDIGRKITALSKGVVLSQSTGEETTHWSDSLPPVDGDPIVSEEESMPKEHDPDPRALLACLSPEEQAEVIADLRRRVQRMLSEPPRGKATAV